MNMLAVQILTVDVIKSWMLLLVPLTVVTFVLPCHFKVRAQAIWTMVLLMCGAKGLFYEYFGGNAGAPDLPEKLIWLWNWASNGLLILFILSLAWWVRKRRAVILPVLAWGIAAIGQYSATVAPDVEKIELPFADLPSTLDGYRIAHVSDIHCSNSARKWRTQAIVNLVNGLEADLICVTGDLVDGKIKRLEEDISPILELAAKDGVYYVRGNHEYHIDDCKWRNWFDTNGVRMLVNECVFPHSGLALGGVNDYISAASHDDVLAEVGRAFVSATNGEFRVLMEHRPNHAEENSEEYGIDLQLSGHTHGGIAPLINLWVKGKNAGFERGIYRVGNMVLNVSPGCGQWPGFPMRFFNRSEITLITLRKAGGAVDGGTQK